MLREIIELGNPILRRPALAVSDLKSPELSQLVIDLMDTMNLAKGVGIAAPQVGVGQRVFIVASKPNERYPNAPLMQPTAMLNPVLEWASLVVAKDWESCLSIPGIRALVPRSTHIRVRYFDHRSSAEVVSELRDFVARIFLHEYDHLDGVVFLDRVESSKDFVTDKEYRRILQEHAVSP